MIRYKLQYNGHEIIRKGLDAIDAIERLCDQYGWNYRVHMVDADHGKYEWAECQVDTNGGINWNMMIYGEVA